MTYGCERRGVIQKRFGESFLDGKEGNRGKNTEQGFAAVIVLVTRERVDFFDTLRQAAPDGLLAFFTGRSDKPHMYSKAQSRCLRPQTQSQEVCSVSEFL